MSNIYVDSVAGSNASSGATWALGKATLAGADATPDAAGDTIYVSGVHAESTASGVTWSFAGTVASPTKILCGDKAAEPPTTATTTGVVTVTGNGVNAVMNGNVYIYGLSFVCGTSGEATNFIMSNGGGESQFYEKCKFTLGGSNSSAAIGFGSGGNGGNAVTIRWKNCDVKFASTSQTINVSQGVYYWNGGSILSGSSAITQLIAFNATRACAMNISGLDLSNGASSMNIFGGTGGTGMIRNSKLPASWTGSVFSGTPSVGCRYEMYNCDSGSTNYRLWIKDFAGELREETTIVKTSGASDGTTAYSWKVVSSANCNEASGRFGSPEMVRWNDTTGSSITVTVDLVHDSVTNLKDSEVWLDVQYLGTSGYPISTFVSDQRADVLTTAADQDTSSATWTTTGLTNPNKQKLIVTFTPQKKGYIHARVIVAKTSKTLYVDPLLQVT